MELSAVNKQPFDFNKRGLLNNIYFNFLRQLSNW